MLKDQHEEASLCDRKALDLVFLLIFLALQTPFHPYCAGRYSIPNAIDLMSISVTLQGLFQPLVGVSFYLRACSRNLVLPASSYNIC
ncbi:MAG: hypothetical protein ACOYKH_01830 [Brevefilum fermentans]|nr:hypothetical protein [Brevefilum fermentans]